MITSVRDPKVAQAIRLKRHASREEHGRFLAEGPQAVREALAHDGILESLFAVDAVHPLVVQAERSGVEVYLVSEDVMGKLTSTVTPQGLVGVVPHLDIDLDALPADGCVAVLHEVRDPGNAGTVLRSADAAGATGVVFTETSVDVYNPKTVRASAGSVFHLPIVRDVTAARTIEHLRAGGARILAMAADGAADIYSEDLWGPIAFVFGNEAHGLPPEIIQQADAVVRVPHDGRAESLNLAAAATVCLFEWARRRRQGSREALETIVAASAHDIRSPLTAMKGFGYALEKRWDAMSDEQRVMMLQGIVYDADRMDTIVRQLVDAARVVAGNLELFAEQVDVARLVEDMGEHLRRDPDHPALDWRGDVGTVMVDPSRLRTTLLAFVEASVWWAREGDIRVEAERDGSLLRMRLSRAGSEVDSAGAESLFVPRKPGTGAGSKIGLFVARGVVGVQGGRTWAEVEDGRLVFHLELPVSPSIARPPNGGSAGPL
ncbi:MAG: TrmH family RNA methyltransferase [Actinomycetota bacterium]